LREGTRLSIAKARAILLIPLDPDKNNFASVMRAHLIAAQLFIGSQLRVDENQLRKQESDNLSELLKLIAEEEKKRIPPPLN